MENSNGYFLLPTELAGQIQKLIDGTFVPAPRPEFVYPTELPKTFYEACMVVECFIDRFDECQFGITHAVLSDNNLEDRHILPTIADLEQRGLEEYNADDRAEVLAFLRWLLTIPEDVRIDHEFELKYALQDLTKLAEDRQEGKDVPPSELFKLYEEILDHSRCRKAWESRADAASPLIAGGAGG